MSQYYLQLAAVIVSLGLAGIGLSWWSGKRITSFDDTQPMEGQQ